MSRKFHSLEFLLASASALTLTGPTLAADLPPVAPPPPAFTWTGVYLGGQIGFAWVSGNLNFNGYDSFSETAFSPSVNNAPSGIIGGAHIGYNFQINQFVVGLEGAVDGTSLSNGVTGNFAGVYGGNGLAADAYSRVQGSIRGRAGFAWDRALLYATGGVAFGGFNTSYTFSGNTSGNPLLNGGNPFYALNEFSSTRVGWTVGGGIDYAITDNWSIFAEYRYTNFGAISYLGIAASGFAATFRLAGAYLNASRSLNQNQAQVGFSYKLGTYAPVALVAKY